MSNPATRKMSTKVQPIRLSTRPRPGYLPEKSRPKRDMVCAGMQPWVGRATGHRVDSFRKRRSCFSPESSDETPIGQVFWLVPPAMPSHPVRPDRGSDILIVGWVTGTYSYGDSSGFAPGFPFKPPVAGRHHNRRPKVGRKRHPDSHSPAQIQVPFAIDGLEEIGPQVVDEPGWRTGRCLRRLILFQNYCNSSE
jgi:hypothetical protein